MYDNLKDVVLSFAFQEVWLKIYYEVRKMPPAVIYIYDKCTGHGDCAEACPEEILYITEEGERWCRPLWEFVENDESRAVYEERIESTDEFVPIRLISDMPACIECMSCVDACTEDAIEIEGEFEGITVEDTE